MKGVTAIPLVEDQARITLNTLASRNAQLSRPSLLPSTTMDTVTSPQDPETEDSESPSQYASDAPRESRVQFSPDDQVKYMTPTTATFSDDYDHSRLGVAFSSPQSSCSDLSTPSSEYSVTTSPVAKTLASRLSFWSRLSKRTSLLPSANQAVDGPVTIPEPLTLTEEQESLDKIMEDGNKEPAVVLDSILAATAPPPASAEERHSELEDKILRECVREFTKGGMYFAYNFGKRFLPSYCVIVLKMPWQI